jgi:hypothetical protein
MGGLRSRRLRARRLLAVALVVVMGAGLLSGCGRKKDDGKDIVKNAIHKTAKLARTFVYDDDAGGKRTTVAGLVEDDYRYQAEVRLNGEPMQEEAASDDALAIRALRAEAVGPLLSAGSTAAVGTNPTVRTSVEAMANGKWVVDPAGAPSLVVTPDDRRKPGDDPVFDALTLLQYTERAVDAAVYVARYNPDAIDPVFKSVEEKALGFPQPKVGAATERWDLKAPPLPKPNSFSNTGSQLVPTVVNFRFMSVYVRAGLIVQVREVIDVAGKLPDLVRDYKLPANTTVVQAVDALNKVRTGQGTTEVIRPRRMVYELRDLGGSESVSMPTDGVVGTLSMVKYRGKAARLGVDAGAQAGG